MMTLKRAAERAAELVLVGLFQLFFAIFWVFVIVAAIVHLILHPTEIIRNMRLQGGHPPRALARSRRSLTFSLPPENDRTADGHHFSSQSDSLFFTRLVPEIRQAVYREVLVAPTVVHIRRTHLRLCSTRCKGADRHRSQNRDLIPLMFCRTCTQPVANDGTIARRLPGESPHRDQILSLLCSCRRIYSEAIDMLYRENTFHVGDVMTMQTLPKCITPHRLGMIRRLQFDITVFHNRSISPDVLDRWQNVCAALGELGGLETLMVVLRSEDTETVYGKIPIESLMMPLKSIRVPQFAVHVPVNCELEESIEGIDEVPFVLHYDNRLQTRVYSCRWF